tara:strand:- start:29876 stop:30322 length:447 start_codon:yes stop_codon:yes gene_type:complete
MKRIFAGYINLKPINGVIFPSYIQNTINKDYIVRDLKSDFYMSTNENTYGKNYIILTSLLKDKKINGVTFLSAFSLPDTLKKRLEIYAIALRNKKEIHFIFEEINLKKKLDIEKIENYLIYRNPFFTEKKTQLKNHENFFVDNKWKFA